MRVCYDLSTFVGFARRGRQAQGLWDRSHRGECGAALSLGSKFGGATRAFSPQSHRDLVFCMALRRSTPQGCYTALTRLAHGLRVLAGRRWYRSPCALSRTMRHCAPRRRLRTPVVGCRCSEPVVISDIVWGTTRAGTNWPTRDRCTVWCPGAAPLRVAAPNSLSAQAA